MKADRLERERHTIQVMIQMYCRGRHRASGTLCHDCQELFAYAMQRIDKCPFQDDKPTCAKCPIHCYRPSLQDKVCDVMRYAGPRMMFYHPILALLHYIDAMKKSTRPAK